MLELILLGSRLDITSGGVVKWRSQERSRSNSKADSKNKHSSWAEKSNQEKMHDFRI